MLAAHKIEKSYGTNRILRGISLEIAAGSFVSLLGPSGSGKTTMLRCIAGLEKPDPASGEIRLNGRVLSGSRTFIPPEKRNLGMVFQNYAVWPHMSVFENVAFPLRIARAAPPIAKVREKVMDTLSLVKLGGLEKRFAHELSGGQQQRVALARALVMSPDLLLLDEPLSNLDALLREDLGSEIRRLQKNLKLTTILVTHDRKEALSLSDRILVLNLGAIEADGAPESLYATPPSPFVAEFLAGGQSVVLPSGETRVFLPRRWRPLDGPASASRPFLIASRLFLGSEYEYWAESAGFSEPIRFFADRRYEMGDEIHLEYKD